MEGDNNKPRHTSRRQGDSVVRCRALVPDAEIGKAEISWIAPDDTEAISIPVPREGPRFAPLGPSRHVAVMQKFSRCQSEADIQSAGFRPDTR
jgi:hypothetical protein